MKKYFDEEETGDYFIDPNDIEHPLFKLMGTTPDWEELWEEGSTSWWSEDDKIWVFLMGARGDESISIEVGNGDISFMEEIHHEMFSVCCEDCFADICLALLDRTEKALNNYGFRTV